MVTVADLVRVVEVHSSDEPIVSSETVRFAWWQEGLDAGEKWDARRRGEIPPEYNGASFQAADNGACSAGQLRKWKRVAGRGGIGWSLPSKQQEAEAWAIRKGWQPA